MKIYLPNPYETTIAKIDSVFDALEDVEARLAEAERFYSHGEFIITIQMFIITILVVAFVGLLLVKFRMAK